MKRYAVRLAIALAAFAAGLLSAASTFKPIPSHAPCGNNELAHASPPPAFGVETAKLNPAQNPPVEAAATDAQTPSVGQRETVAMPGVGRVRITAFETPKDTRLVFENADSDKELLSFTMADDSLDPRLRFKAMHFKGLPDPVIVAVAVSPGGSGATYELTAIASMGDELKELTRNDTFTTSEGGGFYFGDLGRGLGLGLAVWDYVWDYDYEAHHSPHQYEIKFYKWNEGAGRFEWNRVFRTKGKFDSDGAALHSVGLHFRDVREGNSEYNFFGESD